MHGNITTNSCLLEIQFLGCFFLSPVVKDNKLQGLWEPAIEAELRYLAKTLEGQWGITLEGRGSAELPMLLLEWQTFMSRLIKCPPLCCFSLARTNVSFECFIFPVKNYIYEFWKHSQSAGATACKSHSCFPCNWMTLKYSWKAQLQTIAHTSWGGGRISNSSITAENSYPRASTTWCGQKLLNSLFP